MNSDCTYKKEGGTSRYYFSECDYNEKEEVMTDNELIAEFMRWRKTTTGYMVPNTYPIIDGYDTGETEFTDEFLEFDTRWDWLMPVVDRIHKMDKMVCINFYTESNTVVSKIYSWGLGDDVHQKEFESESAIKSVYDAVVNFIKWHEQKFQEEIKGVF